MKSLIKLGALALLSFTAIGCTKSNNETQGQENSQSSESISEGQSSSIKARDIGLEAFQNKINDLSEKSFSRVRITYDVRERVIGTTFARMKDNSFIPQDTEFHHTVVVEQNPYNENSGLGYKVINGEINTQGLEIIRNSTPLFVKHWLSYHNYRRPKEDAVLPDGYSFEEAFDDNPYEMYMYIKGINVSNVNIDGYFFGTEQYLRYFNEDGYCSRLALQDYYEIDGTVASFQSTPQYFKGSYMLEVVGDVEYFND